MAVAIYLPDFSMFIKFSLYRCGHGHILTQNIAQKCDVDARLQARPMRCPSVCLFVVMSPLSVCFVTWNLGVYNFRELTV